MRHHSARLYHRHGSQADIVSVFERSRPRQQKDRDAELQAIESCAIPGPVPARHVHRTPCQRHRGARHELANSSAQNAISPAKMETAAAPATVVQMLRTGLRPSHSHEEGFRERHHLVIALVFHERVLHLLAMANAAKVKLTIDDFTRVANGCRCWGPQAQRQTPDVELVAIAAFVRS